MKRLDAVVDQMVVVNRNEARSLLFAEGLDRPLEPWSVSVADRGRLLRVRHIHTSRYLIIGCFTQLVNLTGQVVIGSLEAKDGMGKFASHELERLVGRG